MNKLFQKLKSGGWEVEEFSYDWQDRMVTQDAGKNKNAEHVYNGVNTRVATGELGQTPNNVFARDGVGVTAPVMRDSNAAYTPGTSERRSGVSTFSHSGIKNANVQTSSAGTVAATRTYDAFGNTVASTGTWKGPFGYAGQFGYQEDASGLKLLGNRYYDPEIGRFITKDPIKDGRNWYVYCDSNPVTAYDANGLVKISVYWRPILNKVGEHWIIMGYHLFIVVTDNVPGSPTYGQTWTYSGGPERKNPLNYGLLESKTGKWGEGNFEVGRIGDQSDGGFGHVGGGGVVIVDDQSDFVDWLEKFNGVEHGMGKKPIAYRPTPVGSNSGNSNGWVGELLEQLNLEDEYWTAINKKPWYSRPWTPGIFKRPW
jgi:RHS repeat-associated protein